MSAETDDRWQRAYAALVALDSLPHDDPSNTLTERLRATVRMAQVEMLHDPDPASPWAFLADPDVEPYPRIP